jgi:hypothetical protein
MDIKFVRPFLIILTFGLIEGTVSLPLCLGQSQNQVIAQDALIEFTYIPPYGTGGNLQGRIHNLDPGSYKVAVYIFVEGLGWWTKPTFAEPLTSIQSDSTWTCNITTGENDLYATGIHAFLLPNSVSPPQAAGVADLPPSLDTISVANISTVRYGRLVLFSGYEWWIKASITPIGPGPNYFSGSQDNVWVDSLGELHLRITQRYGRWFCPEVINKDSPGYGKYTFQVTGEIGQLDRNVVLGLFTWDNASAEYHREIDMEFSRWGVQGDTSAQYVIEPWDQPGNRHRWMMPGWIDSSTHSFTWRQDSIYFLSVKGHQSAPPYDSIIRTLTYKGSYIPTHGNENPRINLWLFNGAPPSDTSDLEVVIKKFEYSGASVGIRDDEFPAHAPSTSVLSQNYPNPFNPVTTLEFFIPHSSDVKLKIYDLLGEEVATLISQPLPAGRYHTEWNASHVSSGIYFCRIQAGSFVASKKLVLLR